MMIADIIVSDQQESVVYDDNAYVIVPESEFVPYSLELHLSQLAGQIELLNTNMQALSQAFSSEVASRNQAMTAIDQAIVSINGALDAYGNSDVTMTNAINTMNQWLNDQVTGQTGIIESRTSQEALSAAFSYMIDAAVAEVEGSVATAYSTKTATALIEDGVSTLRSEAATFTTVTTADGKQAISGWKTVADSAEPSAFYVYADTFYVISPVNGEIQTILPISFVGEFAAHPLPSAYPENSVYKNSVNGNSYILKSGVWALWMEKGLAGQSQLVSYVFMRSAAAPDTPLGGTYSNPVPTGWSDAPTSGALPLWVSKATFIDGGAVPTWSAPVRMDADGLSVQYSVDGTTWHNPPFVSGDVYMRTSSDKEITWSDTIRIVGEPGAVGQGQVKGICFLRASTPPAAPTGGSYADATATGWSDGVPEGTLPLYMTTRVFTSDGAAPQQSVWSTPVLTSAVGKGNKVQFSIDALSWHDTPATADVYMRTGTSDDGGTTWVYSGAVKIKGENGTNGTNGVNGVNGAAGARGAGWFHGASIASAWSDTEANNLMTGLGLTKTFMDKVTLTKGTEPQWSTTKYWNGSAWMEALMVVDGNMVVKGTLLADKIKSNDISSTQMLSNSMTVNSTANTFTKSSGFTNDYEEEVFRHSFTVPSSKTTTGDAITNGSKAVIDIAMVALNAGGLDYRCAFKYFVTVNGYQVDASEVQCVIVQNKPAAYPYGSALSKWGSVITVNAGDVINVVARFCPLSGATNISLADALSSIVIYNKAT